MRKLPLKYIIHFFKFLISQGTEESLKNLQLSHCFIGFCTSEHHCVADIFITWQFWGLSKQLWVAFERDIIILTG